MFYGAPTPETFYAGQRSQPMDLDAAYRHWRAERAVAQQQRQQEMMGAPGQKGWNALAVAREDDTTASSSVPEQSSGRKCGMDSDEGQWDILVNIHRMANDSEVIGRVPQPPPQHPLDRLAEEAAAEQTEEDDDNESVASHASSESEEPAPLVSDSSDDEKEPRRGQRGYPRKAPSASSDSSSEDGSDQAPYQAASPQQTDPDLAYAWQLYQDNLRRHHVARECEKESTNEEEAYE